MKESLKMEPHMPPFIWWKDPKPEILFRVFIFSVKNSEAFMSGKNTTLEIEEVGPIVYTEELFHTDIVYNKENSTLSYTVTRRPIFQEDRNIPGIMNKTIIVPNLSTLVSTRIIVMISLKIYSYATFYLGICWLPI